MADCSECGRLLLSDLDVYGPVDWPVCFACWTDDMQWVEAHAGLLFLNESNRILPLADATGIGHGYFDWIRLHEDRRQGWL